MLRYFTGSRILEISVKKRNGRGNAPKNVADGVLVAQGLPEHVNGCTYAPVVHSTPSELGVLVPFLSLARSQKFQSRQRLERRLEQGGDEGGWGWKSSKKCPKNQNFDFSIFCSELIPVMSE